jgi:hypothetical protein
MQEKASAPGQKFRTSACRGLHASVPEPNTTHFFCQFCLSEKIWTNRRGRFKLKSGLAATGLSDADANGANSEYDAFVSYSRIDLDAR